MKIAVIGTNGMISSYITNFFTVNKYKVSCFGLDTPVEYAYTDFFYMNLESLDFDIDAMLNFDLIIYAAGAGVQAALDTNSTLMYKLNLAVPINLINILKTNNYKGIFVSFGSYMEIGVNDTDLFFNEEQVEFSKYPASNDYTLSKRLFTRFIGSIQMPFTFWHFILPNIFMKGEKGSRLIPYILEYIEKNLNGEDVEKPKFSAGNQDRQYVNFEEVCEIIMLSIEKKINSGIYNIGGGEILQIRALINRIFSFYKFETSEEMFGKEIRRDNDVKCLKLNGSKLKKLIGFEPQTKIESILKNEISR